MAVGRVRVWLEKRGFGFIVTAGDSPDIFVHISQINYRPVRQGDIVSFDIQFDPQGRPRASDVVKVDAGTPLSRWDDIPEVKAKKAREIFSEAIVARDNKDYPLARELFEKAISLFPSRNFFEAYAAMEKNLGNWDRVRAIYGDAMRSFPEDLSILEHLAMAERRAGNLDKCINILRSAFDKHQDNLSLSVNLAQSLVEFAEEYNRFDVLDEARKMFLKVSQSISIQERSHYHKMWILHQRRTRVAWLLLRQAGFKPVRWRVTLPLRGSVPIDGWVLTDPRGYRYSELYGLDGNVLLYCYYGPQVTEAGVRRAEETLRQLTEQDKSIKSDLLFLVLPEIGNLEHYLRGLLEDPESHPTVIPLEENKIENALNNPETIHAYFEQLLSEWVFRRDLYKGNFPVSGRRFFGREKEIRLLNQSINDGRSVGIFGLRKCGKTSLLYQLRLIRQEDFVAYVDPEASPIEDCSWLCWRAVLEWGARLQGRKSRLMMTRYRSEHELPGFRQALRDFAADITTLMSVLSPEARVILMIDEIDKVIPVRGAGWTHSLEMFRFLRGVAQQSAGRFVVLVAGANPAVCEMAQWEGEDNPMFQFFEEMFLPLLPESECRTMVVSLGKGMGVEWEGDALRLVYQLTGGHPYMARRVCSTLIHRFEERPLRVNVDMVREIQPELIMRLDELFLEIKQRLQRDYPEEWEVLEALAHGFGLDEVKELVPGWARALRHLEGYQLIEFRGGQPRFKMELLYKWLVGGDR